MSVSAGCPPSQEMIPAMRNLHQQASFGEESSENLSDIIRKSSPGQTDLKRGGRVKLAMLEYQQSVVDSQQTNSGKSSRAVKRSQKDEASMDVVDMEATGPGAAGQLTGSKSGSRQEQ